MAEDISHTLYSAALRVQSRAILLSHSKAVMLQLVVYDRAYLDCSYAWLRDPEIKKLTMSRDFSKEEQNIFFEGLSSRNDYYIWGVEFAGQRSGVAGLKNVVGNIGEYWGYIGNKELWGRGLGMNMISLVEEKAKTIGLLKLYLKVSRDNERAIRLYRRANYEDVVILNQDTICMEKII